MARLHLPTIALLVVLAAPLVLSTINTPIPEDKSQLQAWFNSNVKSLANRKGTLDPELEAAEAKPRVIKVRTDGSGEFKTITDAVKSIPTDNKHRVIISLGPGEYKEKVTIDRYKPFVTLYGEGKAKPNLTFAGTAAKYGTVYSATLTVESNYFMAVNIGIVNSAPPPDGKTVGAQGLAMRIGGDKAAFYNCRFYGFQDTLCDDAGNHFFKDCFIQGTYDFIFGSGTSLYLNTHLHAVGDGLRVITAQSGDPSPNTGYAFVHGTITGTGKGVFLGRAWKDSPEVVYAYTDMGGIVDPTGWKDTSTPGKKSHALYGEYKCSGAGAQKQSREFVRQLEPKEAAPYLTLDYIKASKWLLPPRTV